MVECLNRSVNGDDALVPQIHFQREEVKIEEAVEMLPHNPVDEDAIEMLPANHVDVDALKMLLPPSEVEEEEEKLDTECIVCLNTMVEPVTLPCNHTFCRECLNVFFRTKVECPLCR